MSGVRRIKGLALALAVPAALLAGDAVSPARACVPAYSEHGAPVTLTEGTGTTIEGRVAGIAASIARGPDGRDSAPIVTLSVRTETGTVTVEIVPETVATDAAGASIDPATVGPGARVRVNGTPGTANAVRATTIVRLDP